MKMEDSFDYDHYLTWSPQLNVFSHGLTYSWNVNTEPWPLTFMLTLHNRYLVMGHGSCMLYTRATVLCALDTCALSSFNEA